MNTNIRLVRCPKCRKILPELPGISVYQCGGCGTILQAKRKKNDSTIRDERESVSDCSIQEARPPFSESSPGSNNRAHHIDVVNHRSEQLYGTNFSDELAGSSELRCEGVEKLSLETKGRIEQGENKSPSGQDAGLCKNESLNCRSRKLGDKNPSDELPDSCLPTYHEDGDMCKSVEQDDERCSPKQMLGKYAKESQDGCNEWTGDEQCSNEVHRLDEPSHQKAETSCPEVGREEIYSDELNSSYDLSYRKSKTLFPGVSEHEKLDEEKDFSKQCLSSDQSEYSDNKAGKPEGHHHLVEAPPTNDVHQHELSPGDGEQTEGDERKYLSEQLNNKSLHKFLGQVQESSQNMKFAGETSSSALVARQEVEISVLGEVYSAVDEGSTSHFKSSHVEGSLGQKKDNVLICSHKLSNESFLSHNPSANDEYVEQTQKEVQGNLDRVSSEKILESLPFNPRHPIGSMSKSPTRIYYGCAASESSYGGSDDISDPLTHLYKSKFKATDRSQRKDGPSVQKMHNSEFEIHYEPTAPSTIPEEKNNLAITEQDWRQYEFLEPRRHDRSVRTSSRFSKDDHNSRMPYVSKNSQVLPENGSPSSSRHNVLQHHAGSYSPVTISYESEKMELLRMVYELEDKLNRTKISKHMSNGRYTSGFPGEEKFRTYYNDLATEGNPYADLDSLRHIDSFPQGIGLPQQSKASNCRDQTDCLCSHCRHQEWQYSTKLSSHYNHHGKGQFMTHQSQYHQNVYPSCSSSPQHQTSTELPSWDHKQKEHDMKEIHLREKYQVGKRYIRSLAGGSPIIACFHCSNLLQLPADFILFKRRCHKLRCSSCNQILKFSLQKKVHLVPYVPSTPPPTELDDNSVAANNRHLASTSHYKYCPFVGPVSHSDDCEPSFCRSCSNEGEPSALTYHTCNRKMPSSNAFETIEDRKMKSVSWKFRNLPKNSEEKSEAIGPSEIQEQIPASVFPLHRLMGYSSASQVFASPSDDSEVFSNYE